MTTPSHKSSMSVSGTNLIPPGSSPVTKQRRMTAPSLPPPPSPLNLPEPVYGHRRPPSPLRQAVTVNPDTGEISEDGSNSGEDEDWNNRPMSPSVAQFAANFAQRVGSLVTNMSQQSLNHLPTDAELEAEAERQREKSRREAERILSREAETKRLEQRVLDMLESTNSRTGFTPPPPLSDTTPGTPPSPSNSQKEGGWWAVAKSRLTPTKEPLTPAQQIIQDTKAREKELEKEKKELEKERKEAEKEMKKQYKKQEKQRSKEWPSSPENKFEDPAFANLGVPAGPPRQMSASPSPMRAGSSNTPSLAPSPLRTLSNDGNASPSRQAPPLYAQFNSQGTLDVPGTLLVIAQRFEKLERWTVGHVRALEERMDDVEKWLVDKEKEREKEPTSVKPVVPQQTGDLSTFEALREVRDELAEVQGRIGELGREMAKLVTSPNNLSSGPSRTPASLGRAPSTSSSIAVRSISSQVSTAPRQLTPPRNKEQTSTPVSSPPASASRTRLPYPTGDYATPPDSVLLHQGPFSPPNSPPSSLNPASQNRQGISGLPADSSSPTESSGLPRSTSPLSMSDSTSSLPAPTSSSSQRPSSVSPTPRKRNTVSSAAATKKINDAVFFSTSPLNDQDDTTDGEESDDFYNDETIGKAAARTAGLTINKINKNTSAKSRRESISPTTSPTNSPSSNSKRARPQSMYIGSAASQQNLTSMTTAPLHSRMRSRSTDRFGLGISDMGATVSTPNLNGKFVDPLLVRKQTKEALANGTPVPPKAMTGRPKVPVGQLVAFFDQEKS
ncbi:hypothetical protein ABKN59_006210 [Abortiporus biennis]